MGVFDGDAFRFEATEFYTGRVKAVLEPIGAEWEEGYSLPTTGSLVLATRDNSQDDIWSGTTGIYISQVLPDGSRLPRFGGYTENFDGAGGGDSTIAVKSIDTFLNERLLANDDGGLDLVNADTELAVGIPNPASPDDYTTDEFILAGGVAKQASLAKTLVDVAMLGKGHIPLTSVADPPNTRSTSQTYRWWEFKNIGQAIRDLVEAEKGVKYWLEHSFADGYWSTVIHFSDSIGTDRDYVLKSDREGWNYSLSVDAKDKASRVYGIGGGEEANTQFSVAYDAAETLPEYQTTVAWKDQTDPTTIDSLTSGYVVDHRDPVAIPAMTIAGLPDYMDPGRDPQQGYPPPEILKPGDTFGVELGYGLITIRDIRTRCLAVSWRLEQGKPPMRTIAMQPIIRPSESIRTQTPAKPPAEDIPLTQTDPTLGGGGAVTADPWPTPGLVTRVHPDYLHEISGMQLSFANPGHVLVHNDNEVDDAGNQIGTIFLISLSTGNMVGKWRVGGGTLPTPTDTEAIRMRQSDGRMFLGDFGDNDDVRPYGRIYGFTEPTGGGDKGQIPATMTRIKYPFGGGWVNTESLLIHPVTGVFYTITKQSGKAKVVSFGQFPSDLMTGTTVKTLTDVEKVTDATFVLNGQYALLRAYQVAKTLVYRTSDWTRVGAIDTPSMPKSESITIESTCAFLVGTEAKPHEPVSETETPIYRVLIPTQFGAKCGTTAGPSGTGGTTAPSGPVVPGQVIDLSNWKLTLPTGSAGHPTEITLPALSTYENPSYFWADTKAAGVKFKCPVNGVTTPGSLYPRCELRQMKTGTAETKAWSNASKTWTMACVLRFDHLPGGKPHVVGMQIHDSNDDVTVLRKEGTDLYVTQGDNTHFKKIASGVTDTTILNMRVVAKAGGGIDWYRDNVKVASLPGVVSGGYFKAGAYPQANSSNGSGYGQVTIFGLGIAKS